MLDVGIARRQSTLGAPVVGASTFDDAELDDDSFLDLDKLLTVVPAIRLNHHCLAESASQDRAQLPNVVTLPQGAIPRRHAQVMNVLAKQDNIMTPVA